MPTPKKGENRDLERSHISKRKKMKSLDKISLSIKKKIKMYKESYCLGPNESSPKKQNLNVLDGTQMMKKKKIRKQMKGRMSQN